MNTGVAHVVSFVEDLENLDVVSHGRALREHDYFAPAGTNANFVKLLAPDHIAIRTYERGVEDETLACGTGMVACALIHNLLTGAESPVKVDVEGGGHPFHRFRRKPETPHSPTSLSPPPPISSTRARLRSEVAGNTLLYEALLEDRRINDA